MKTRSDLQDTPIDDVSLRVTQFVSKKRNRHAAKEATLIGTEIPPKKKAKSARAEKRETLLTTSLYNVSAELREVLPLEPQVPRTQVYPSHWRKQISFICN